MWVQYRIFILTTSCNFRANASERMRITSAGLVGIGTSTPTHNLTVDGGTSTNIALIKDATGAATVRYFDGGSQKAYIQLTTAEDMDFFAASGVDQIFYGQGVERMRLNGGVVFNEGSVDADFRVESNGDANMLYVDGGNNRVGIGTSTPAATLHVDASGGGSVQISRTSSGALYLESDGTNGNIRSTSSSGSLAFQTNGNNERMRISANGNIGIGTTSSTAAKVLIDHTGDADDNGLYVYSNLGQTVPLFQVIQDGAGSTAPSAYIRNDDVDGIALQLHKGGSSVTPHENANSLFIEDDNNTGITIATPTNRVGNIFFADSGSNFDGYLQYNHTIRAMIFGTATAERVRIDSSGNLLVGKTTTGQGTRGAVLGYGFLTATQDGDAPIQINRLTNDGRLVEFRQDTSLEGNISVSGNTVSYNGFTGTHWSRFQDNSTPTILRGTVLETLDEMCDWYNLEFDVTTTTQDEDGNDVTNTHTEKVPHVLTDTQSVGDVITYNHEGTDYQATIVKEADVKHMMSKVSDTVDAKNVYGLFVAYDLDGEGYNDFLVASVGSYVVRIKSGQTIAKGDLLQSNGDGTAKVQIDDNIKSSSFAKVLSTTKIETYEDGSYLVPCSLMC